MFFCWVDQPCSLCSPTVVRRQTHPWLVSLASHGHDQSRPLWRRSWAVHKILSLLFFLATPSSPASSTTHTWEVDIASIDLNNKPHMHRDLLSSAQLFPGRRLAISFARTAMHDGCRKTTKASAPIRAPETERRSTSYRDACTSMRDWRRRHSNWSSSYLDVPRPMSRSQCSFRAMICHLEQLHAQSPFLFPIVFSINIFVVLFCVTAVVSMPRLANFSPCDPQIFCFSLTLYTHSLLKNEFFSDVHG